MKQRNLWVGVLAVLGCGAMGLACPAEETAAATQGPECLIDAPCEDDPSMMCKVNVCGNQGGPGISAPTGTGGDGGGGSGGGGGSVSVDLSGSVVQFTSTAFDDTAPYTGLITVIAPGASTTTVEADTVNGAFELTAAASGVQWVLAKDGDGGTFSTYSLQDLAEATPLVLPVVTVETVDTIATQVTLASLKSGSAHLVIEVQDLDGFLLEGVELPTLSGSTVAYDVAPGQYAVGVPGTGSQGLAVAMNVAVAASGMVTLGLLYDGGSYPVTLAIAPDTVTYRQVTLDTSP